MLVESSSGTDFMAAKEDQRNLRLILRSLHLVSVPTIASLADSPGIEEASHICCLSLSLRYPPQCQWPPPPTKPKPSDTLGPA
jgi:hypothetical protein